MPSRAINLRHAGPTAADEVAVGTCPIGSWVELYDLEDQLIYRGYVQDQRTTWGYTVVQPITEGDGNFIGHAETWAIDKVRWEGQRKVVERVSDGTLQRIYQMSDRQYVQCGAPCKWLGVDEELVTELGLGAVNVADATNAEPAGSARVMSLVPTVSLMTIVEEGD